MKAWQQRERARAILAKETGYVTKPHGGRLRVALAFPNTYWVGMSNLGFQTVYRLLNARDDIVCERVFLPPKQEAIEAQFKKELRAKHGIDFNRLYTITNMPISRFLEFLVESGNYDLVVIPLFLLMGQFATHGGLSSALFRFVSAFLGHLRGGIAMASIGACAGFGAICGSSIATEPNRPWNRWPVTRIRALTKPV